MRYFITQSLSLLAILILLQISSCKKSDETSTNTPAPASEGTSNTVSLRYSIDTLWVSGPEAATALDLYTPTSGVKAEYRGDSLRISSVFGKRAFVLSTKVNPGIVGTYNFTYKVKTYQPGNSNKFYFGETTRIRSNVTDNEGTLSLTVSSADTATRIMNATFSGTMNWDGRIYAISSGKFVNLKYDRQAAAPVDLPAGRLQLNVKNSQGRDTTWIAETAVARLKGTDTLQIYATRNRATLETSETFQMLYPLTAVKVGYYGIDVSKVEKYKFLYFGTFDGYQNILGAPDNSLAGSFKVTEFNTSPKYISLEFDFNTKAYTNEIKVTNGRAFRIPIQ